MARSFAGILGLLAFTLSLFRGVCEGHAAASTMTFAAGALFLFASLGYLFGRIAERTVAEAVLLQLGRQAEKREEA